MSISTNLNEIEYFALNLSDLTKLNEFWNYHFVLGEFLQKTINKSNRLDPTYQKM